MKRMVFCWLLAGPLVWPGLGVEPPLPGEDGPRPEREAFQPLLRPGDELPPGSEAPALPEGPGELPPELFPEGPGGSDGVDGLPPAEGPEELLPKAAVRGAGEVEVPLLPPPAEVPSVSGLELAARAYWHKSPREAREVSRRERKPLLMLFYTRWKSAPVSAVGGGSGDPSIALTDDLLATAEFNAFAAERVALARLFYPIGSPGSEYTPERLAALKQFKEYFKVNGFRCLLLLDENGRELERIKGYARVKTGRGQELNGAMPILERLRVAVERREAVVAAADERRQRLEAQHYREWTSQAGSRLLGKLVSAAEGEVVLRDEGGALRRVGMEQLSIVDQAWISRQPRGQAVAGE